MIANGDIMVLPEAVPFYFSPAELALSGGLTLKGHSKAITCLYAVDLPSKKDRKLLFSGSRDCVTKLWDIQ
jgi:WD40 repeat protein